MIRTIDRTNKTFKCRVEASLDCIKSLPGKYCHILFDDFKYSYSVPSKERAVSGRETEKNEWNQELPNSNELNNFFLHDMKKFRLVNLIVNYRNSENCALRKKLYFINLSICCGRKPLQTHSFTKFCLFFFSRQDRHWLAIKESFLGESQHMPSKMKNTRTSYPLSIVSPDQKSLNMKVLKASCT